MTSVPCGKQHNSELNIWKSIISWEKSINPQQELKSEISFPWHLFSFWVQRFQYKKINFIEIVNYFGNPFPETAHYSISALKNQFPY